jgi:hypothetical protein
MSLYLLFWRLHDHSHDPALQYHLGLFQLVSCYWIPLPVGGNRDEEVPLVLHGPLPIQPIGRQGDVENVVGS